MELQDAPEWGSWQSTWPIRVLVVKLKGSIRSLVENSASNPAAIPSVFLLKSGLLWTVFRLPYIPQSWRRNSNGVACMSVRGSSIGSSQAGEISEGFAALSMALAMRDCMSDMGPGGNIGGRICEVFANLIQKCAWKWCSAATRCTREGFWAIEVAYPCNCRSSQGASPESCRKLDFQLDRDPFSFLANQNYFGVLLGSHTTPLVLARKF